MYAFHAAALLPGEGSTSWRVTALAPILAIGLRQVPAISELIIAVVIVPLGGATGPVDLDVTGAPKYGHDLLTHDAPKGDFAIKVFHQPSAAAGTRAVLNVHLHGSCQTHDPLSTSPPRVAIMILRTRSGVNPLIMGRPSVRVVSVTDRFAHMSARVGGSLVRTRPLHG